MSHYITTAQYTTMGNVLGAEVAAVASRASYDSTEEYELIERMVFAKNHGRDETKFH